MNDETTTEYYCTTCGMVIYECELNAPGFSQWIAEHKAKDENYLIRRGCYPVGGRYKNLCEATK